MRYSALDTQRPQHIAGLHSTVLHSLLFRCDMTTHQNWIKRQGKFFGKTAGKTWHKVWMAMGWYGSDPVGKWHRFPCLCNQPGGSLNQFIIEVSILVFTLADQPSPTGIAIITQGAPLFISQFIANGSLFPGEEIHRPLLTRLNEYGILFQKVFGSNHKGRTDLRWQTFVLAIRAAPTRTGVGIIKCTL